jgi:hypothetical protein
MLIVIVQLILGLIAGGALFLGWRAILLRNRTIGLIVGGGLALRLIGGQVLYWIAVLEVPIFRALHSRDGFWFFALDSIGYFRRASRISSDGLSAVLIPADAVNAPFFVHAYALTLFLFGAIPVAAVLLNAFAYIGTTSIMARIGGSDRLCVLSVAALAFSPSMILWSLQGLKDVVFFFLITALLGAAWLWQRSQLEGTGVRSPLAAGVAILAALYGIGGIRWYFAALFLAMLVPFLFVVALRSRARVRAFAATLVLIPMMIVVTAVPLRRHLLPTAQSLAARNYNPAEMVLFMMMRARSSFDRAGGATLIGAGPALEPVDARDESAANPESRKRVERRKSRAASEPTARARRTGDDSRRPRVSVPQSHAGRLLAGVSAMVLPRAVGNRLGLVDIRGGRGLFLFAEVGTIWFDGMMALVAVAIYTSVRRGTWRSPVVWMVFAVAVTLGGILAYTVSNFGTFFRHRDMVMMLLALVPVMIASERRRIDRVSSEVTGAS